MDSPKFSFFICWEVFRGPGSPAPVWPPGVGCAVRGGNAGRDVGVRVSPAVRGAPLGAHKSQATQPVTAGSRPETVGEGNGGNTLEMVLETGCRRDCPRGGAGSARREEEKQLGCSPGGGRRGWGSGGADGRRRLV